MKTEQNENILRESAVATAKAIVRFVRIAPRKVRPVTDAIRWRPVQDAFDILMVLNKKAARITEKLLKSAVANAKVLKMDETRLYISDIRADGGPTMKRFMSRSMGRADRILKRSTHLSIVLKEGNTKRELPPAGNIPESAETEGKKGKQSKFKSPFGRGKKKAASAAS